MISIECAKRLLPRPGRAGIRADFVGISRSFDAARRDVWPSARHWKNAGKNVLGLEYPMCQGPEHVQADQRSQSVGRQRMQLPEQVRQLAALRYQCRQRKESEATGCVSRRIGLQPSEQRYG